MKKINLLFQFALITASVAMFAASISAQRGGIKTDSRILYHNGPVMQGTSEVYLIWYGNWGGDTTTAILTDLAYGLGSSPYLRINTAYPDASGSAPNGALVYGGAVSDAYSQGPTLTVQNIQQIVADQINAGNLPLDTAGIYLVIGSADVTDLRPDGTMYCTPGSPPHHGVGVFSGTYFKYGYLGNANRCPTTAGPQFYGAGGQLPTPNGNFAADVAASTMARLLNVILTNPVGTGLSYGGWYDRNGLENADKCAGTFGTTYTEPNSGARANMQLGQRHYLIQQNWVNERRGRCALSYP